MEKMCVSEFAAEDYLTREEQQRLLNTYRENGIRRWHSSNAGTKTCDKGVMFFSYYTCLCIVHNASDNKVEFMPYVYAHSEFVHSRTTSRQLDKFLHSNGINTSIAHIADMYDSLCNGIRMPCLYNSLNTPIDIQFYPHEVYVNDNGLYCEKATFKVPRIIMTHDGTECIGVYD